ncbi:MAG TPA: VOC family protein, partial [Vicinamibacterales bacterium]|nr:VOC family protein [Vicinamibacterales bacterium]
MKARSFSHVGITVKNFNEFVRFYWDVFGCPLVGASDSPTDRVRGFFGVDGAAPTCKIGWIRVPGGAVLEIFEFQPQQSPVPGPWNRVGMTHFSLNVSGIHKWHAYLKSKGVTIVSEPMQSPNGGQWFFFVKDCDGN